MNGNGIYLPNPNAEKANAQRGKSLEALLATKNKRLLEELTKFRVCIHNLGLARSLNFSTPQILHGGFETSLQAAEEQLALTKAELEKQKTLNEKLENDLVSMDKHKPNGDVTPVSNVESTDGLAGLELGKKTVRLCV